MGGERPWLASNLEADLRNLLALAICFAGLALPATAVASDTYVNKQTGDDSNTCTGPGTPCATIQAGIDQAGSGDTVHVQAPSGGPVTYGGGFSITPTASLGDGKSLVAESPDPTQTEITSPSSVASIPPISITSNAGTISGFTVQSFLSSVDTSHDVTLEHDRFTQLGLSGTPSNPLPTVYVHSGSTTFRGDTFVDSNPTDQNKGMTAIKLDDGSGTTRVIDSTFSGFKNPIQAVPASSTGGGSLNVSGSMLDLNDQEGIPVGIDVSDQTANISDSTIHATSHPGGSPALGIRLQEGPNAAATGATISRSVLSNLFQEAIGVTDTLGSVDLNDDLITGTSIAILMQNTGSGGGNVTATNLTVSGFIQNLGAHLDLDSSILTDNIPGTGTCTITFSRGDPMGIIGNNGCWDFQSTAAPGFVDPGADYHLAPSSPLIDAGSPATPTAGALDLDGNARALSSVASCTSPDPGRRDMGAYELVPQRLDCPAPPVQPGPAPPGGPVSQGPATTKRAKKCKKKFRHNAKARKKCLRKARHR
jgi:hypothetical protein